LKFQSLCLVQLSAQSKGMAYSHSAWGSENPVVQFGIIKIKDDKKKLDLRTYRTNYKYIALLVYEQ